MNKINTVIPIPNWKYTLGELPTSYLESMTYQEQLLWMLNYLSTQITPNINLLITNFNEMFDSFDNLSDDFTELETTVNNALEKLQEDLTAGLNAIETSLSAELPALAETVISAKIAAGELNCQLGTSYDSDDEELTFTIQIVPEE